MIALADLLPLLFPLLALGVALDLYKRLRDRLPLRLVDDRRVSLLMAVLTDRQKEKKVEKTYDDPEIAASVTNLLRHDPLDSAEKFVGKSWEESGLTQALGVLGALEHSAQKIAILQASDDTTLTNDVRNYCRILKEEGFVRVLHESFYGHERLESIQVWWNAPDGLLLRFDTYGADHVNSASVYYNWIPAEGVSRWQYTSSGGFEGPDDRLVWVGNHDAREALRLNLHNLRSNGQFISPWRYRPFLRMVSYMESRAAPTEYPAKGACFDQIRDQRILRLPSEVQAAICGEREVATNGHR